MNYFIKRELNEYGPYSLADLQKYVASGNILLTDLCRSEGLTDWVPVSQVIGNIPVPAAAPQPSAPAAGTVYGGTPAYGAPAGYAAPAQQYPPPPNLHWALVLLISLLGCSIFPTIWLIVEAVWIRKVLPSSKGFKYLMVTIGLLVLGIVVFISMSAKSAGAERPQPALGAIVGLIFLGYVVMHIVTVFAMRSDIEEHFNTAEPIGLSLSGVMTFFFAVFYFQYHFSRINEMKRQQMMGYPR
jgi:hypothetical protein